MSFIVNGTTGLTFPDATNQTSAFLNPGSTSGAPLVSNGTSWSQTTPVGVAFGGTGATTQAAAQTALGVPASNGTGASGTWAINITGNATGNGNPAGTVLMWAGASAPAGYVLCDGSAISRTTYAALFAVISTTYGAGDGSTTFNIPNYLGRSPLGSNGTYPLASTGGNASTTLSTANIPAHTHNYSGSVSGNTGGTSNDHTHSITDNGHQHGYRLDQNGAGIAIVGNQGNVGGATLGEGTGPQGSISTATGSSTTGITSTNGQTAGHTHAFSAGFSGTTDNGTGSGTAFTNLQPYLAINFIIKT